MVVNSMKRTKLEKKNILKVVVAFAVALAFIMPGVSSVTNDEMTFAGTTIYVDDSNTAGPWNGTIDYPYQYIQDGINATSIGDTIIVNDGTYSEDLVIGKTDLTIKSVNGYDTTIVDTQGTSPGVEIQGSGLVLGLVGQGFTFKGLSPHLISLPNNPYDVVISYCYFDLTGAPTQAIDCAEASLNNMTVDNCSFLSVEAGECIIYGSNVHHSMFSNNWFNGSGKDVSTGTGIMIWGCPYTTYLNNRFTDIGTALSIWGNSLYEGVITDNTITGCTFTRCTNGILFGEGAANEVDITTIVMNDNNFDENTYGIIIWDSPDGHIKASQFTVINNNFNDNTYAVKNDYAIETVNATDNYWGHASGPYHLITNPNGLGDNVSDNVEFVPWIGYYSWSVLLNIEDQYGVIGDTVIFGEKPDAFDGQDTYDAVKQPTPPPIPYVYTWFDAGLSEPYDMLWEDYRDYPDDNEIWDLYITCNTTTLASVNLVVSWNTIDTDAAEYDHIRLYDLSDVLLADMKAVDSYVFSAEFEYLYHFQIRCSMNNVPIAYDDFYTTGEDVTLTVPSPGVLGNDEDVENTPLIALLESDVSNGTLTLNANGSFEYIPSIGFSGDDSFTYKANDGIDDSTLATVSITVLECHYVPLQQYWNLMSLPISEPVDKTQIVIRSGGTDYTWSEAVSGQIILDNLYDWNTTMQCYAVESSTFNPGRAYWMWAYQNCEILIYSNDVGTGDITTIQMKWKLVGFPYDISLVKENLIVHYNGTDYSWDEATTSNNPTGSPIVLKFLYGWERTSQRYAYADSFDAGEGYWMYAYKTCNLTNPLI